MIDIIDLNKTFNNKVEAVKDFSLKVEKGEVISLIGPSGSGKSTVLRCIAGLETPDKGKILINGQAINFRNEKLARKQRTIMGFVFQHFNLFSNMTVLKNLTVAPALKTRQMSFPASFREDSSSVWPLPVPYA